MLYQHHTKLFNFFFLIFFNFFSTIFQLFSTFSTFFLHFFSPKLFFLSLNFLNFCCCFGFIHNAQNIFNELCEKFKSFIHLYFKSTKILKLNCQIF